MQSSEDGAFALCARVGVKVYVWLLTSLWYVIVLHRLAFQTIYFELTMNNFLIQNISACDWRTTRSSCSPTLSRMAS